MQVDKEVITNVWVDGSCINNGTVSARAGIGIFYGDDDERNYCSRLTKVKQTNNAAELISILYVLCTNADTSLRVHTDSEYSIKCVTVYCRKWSQNGWKTAKGTEVESAAIIKSIVKEIERRSSNGTKTVFVHVKGHSGNEHNEAADKLARSGAGVDSEGGRIKLLRACGVPV